MTKRESSVVRITVDGKISAPASAVYGYIADYREHHPRFLPPAFDRFVIEEGGVGAGTVVRFDVTVGGKRQRFHADIEEPIPGRLLIERDRNEDAVTSFNVQPDGEGSRVRIETVYPAAPGLRGRIERLIAPLLLRRLYRDELDRLNEYARQQATDRERNGAEA